MFKKIRHFGEDSPVAGGAIHEDKVEMALRRKLIVENRIEIVADFIFKTLIHPFDKDPPADLFGKRSS